MPETEDSDSVDEFSYNQIDIQNPNAQMPRRPSALSTEEPSTSKVYKRRWYILAIFSWISLHWCVVWNSYGPITYAIQYSYGWSDSTLAMMPNWGCILFVLSLYPLTKLLESKGIRPALLTVSLLCFIGTVIRVFSTDDDIFLVTSHLGSILNGICGVTLMSGPAPIATAWFPTSERIFAISVAQGFNIAGIGAAYLIGPLFVPFNNSNTQTFHKGDNITSEIQETRDDIQHFMIFNATISGILFLLILAYFPSKPPRPPTAFSSLARLNFDQGLKESLKSGQLWLIALVGGVPNGAAAAFQGTMAITFKPLGVTDTEVGFIGFLAVIAQLFGSTAVGFTMDRFRSQLKLMVMFLLAVSALNFAWVALICFKVIPFQLWQLYIATMIACGASYACYPLTMEYGVLASYPIPEGIFGAIISGLLNFSAITILTIFDIPDIGTDWLNYSLVVIVAVMIPVIWTTKDPVDAAVIGPPPPESPEMQRLLDA